MYKKNMIDCYYLNDSNAFTKIATLCNINYSRKLMEKFGDRRS